MAWSSASRGYGAPYPLQASTDGRYFLTANNQPFFLVGDGGAQGLQQQLLTDVDYYLKTRVSQGFNALWMHVMMNNQDGANNTSNGATHDGIKPFTGVLSGSITDPAPVYDLTTPNEAFFQRQDQILRMCADNGFVVFYDLMENNSYLSVYQANGDTRMQAYATYLANRYHDFPNILWMVGNDFQTWNTVPTDNQLAADIMSSLAAKDLRKIQTTELNFNMSKSSDNTLLTPYTKAPSAYTYYPVYYEVGQQYAANAGPTYLVESYYEGFTYGNLTPTSTTNAMLRRIAWWTPLSGGLGGYFYGSKWFDFGTGWQAGLVSTAVSQIGIWKNFFTSYANWYRLVPDSSNVVVTSGFGTATGNLAGRIDTDTYVTTARVSDGSLVISYVPSNTSPVVDMTKLRGTVTAQWFDPTTAVYSAIGSFANTGSHTFTNPGNNSAGDPDQVLVLTA